MSENPFSEQVEIRDHRCEVGELCLIAA